MVIFMLVFLWLLGTSVVVEAQSSASLTRTCVVGIGSRIPGSPALHADADLPDMCPNDMGVNWTIRSVACKTNTGTLNLLPILTGKSTTSIIQQPLTCGVGRWAKGALNGTPVVRSFSTTNADTCNTTPCTVDIQVESVDQSQYAVIKITGRIQ